MGNGGGEKTAVFRTFHSVLVRSKQSANIKACKSWDSSPVGRLIGSQFWLYFYLFHIHTGCFFCFVFFLSETETVGKTEEGCWRKKDDGKSFSAFIKVTNQRQGLTWHHLLFLACLRDKQDTSQRLGCSCWISQHFFTAIRPNCVHALTRQLISTCVLMWHNKRPSFMKHMAAEKKTDRLKARGGFQRRTLHCSECRFRKCKCHSRVNR